jgi:hypothetical protein
MTIRAANAELEDAVVTPWNPALRSGLLVAGVLSSQCAPVHCDRHSHHPESEQYRRRPEAWQVSVDAK